MLNTIQKSTSPPTKQLKKRMSINTSSLQSLDRKKPKCLPIDRQEIIHKITLSIERNCELDTISADNLSAQLLSGIITTTYFLKYIYCWLKLCQS